MSNAQISFLDEIIVDSFAGGGGASTGIELATGRVVNVAINHDPNVPDLEAMIRVAAKDGFDICDYCPDFRCNECIVNRWKGEPGGE